MRFWRGGGGSRRSGGLLGLVLGLVWGGELVRAGERARDGVCGWKRKRKREGNAPDEEACWPWWHCSRSMLVRVLSVLIESRERERGLEEVWESARALSPVVGADGEGPGASCVEREGLASGRVFCACVT